MTFAAFSQIFLDEKKKSNMKVLAYKALEDQVKRVCTFVGTAKLSDIDSDMVQQMVFTLAEQGYSESVMTKAKIAAFSVLKMAAAKHYINTVPVLNITIPRAKKQDDDRQVKKNWLRDDELALYEAECRRTYVPKKYTKYAGQTLMVHPAGHKLLFILHTGLRLGEALALTWTDYDEYSKTVMIDKNTVYADGEKITQMPKTESGERLIECERVRGREQGAREGQTALHAAGPVPHPLASRIAEPQLREQGARGGLVVSRAEREAQVACGVELLEQAVLLKDRRPAEAVGVGRAAVRTLQPQQNAQQRRFADAGAARDAREADPGGKAHALQHRCAAVAFAEIFHPKLHQAHHLSVSASTPRRNSPSNRTESSTITAVHAKRSAV